MSRNITYRSAVIQESKQKVLPVVFENPQVSVSQSVEFLKKLTVVAVSSISYLRNIFPEYSFAKRKLDGMTVRILKGDDEVPGARTLIKWLKSAFTAVEAHYLKKMVLVIEKHNLNKTLEVYTFNFAYNKESIMCHIEENGNKLCSVAGQDSSENQECPSEIKKAAQQLIRSVLTLTTTLNPLPDDCGLSMRLEFNESAPDDYRPDHFKLADSLGIEFPAEAHTLKLGKVETKFTTIAVSTKSVLSTLGEGYADNQELEQEQEDEEDELVEPSQSAPDHCTSFTSPAYSNTPHQASGAIVPASASASASTLASASVSASATFLSEGVSHVSLRDKEVKCICECSVDQKDDIKCGSCSTYQHRACYKILSDLPVLGHFCVDCHEPEKNQICTAPDLVNNKKRKEGALYRRALLLCINSVRVSSNTFVNQLNVSRQTAQQIFNRLDIDGCLRATTGKGNIRTIQTEHLKQNILGLYFNETSIQPDNTSNSMETDENDVNESNVPENTASVNSKKRKWNPNEYDENFPNEVDFVRKNKRCAHSEVNKI